jgi:catechol 2,3-dioxygenase-like lactoylglutathione lyase family enzyme
MSVTRASVGAITLFVADAQRSKSFYSDVFDLEPVYPSSGK